MSLLKAFIMSPVYNCLTQLHKLNGRYLYDWITSLCTHALVIPDSSMGYTLSEQTYNSLLRQSSMLLDNR